MTLYYKKSLGKYLDALAERAPTPGGGSAAALTGALAASLISMVTRYSLKKGQPKTIENRLKRILKESETYRKRFLILVDLDAEAYLNVVKSRKSSLAVRRNALKAAQKVPGEVCHLCYKALKLTPFLVKKGNQNLISDVQCAVELLLAAFNASVVFYRQN